LRRLYLDTSLLVAALVHETGTATAQTFLQHPADLAAWLASLNVQYRHFRYVVSFLVQLGFYVSPVGFSSAIVPEQWQLLYALNPLGFGLSMAIVALLLVTGIRQFRRMEKRFADVI
jgi:ABC-type polysaccharide/polyol phosphate export permease